MHGYELGRSIEEGFGSSLWRIATSQLYAVLHRLEEAGWATAHVEASEARPTRKVYAVTDEGRRTFETWVNAPVPHLRDMRVEFLAKIYFLLRRGAKEYVEGLLRLQREVLAESEAGLHEREQVESDNPAFGTLVASFRRNRMRSMIEWLDESRRLLLETENES